MFPIVAVANYRKLSRLRRRQWHPTPVLLPGKSHGRRSLVGCSPWGHKESNMTEQLHFHFSLWCTGEGNGNPLQCSCLENPRDRGAWWAAVYGVAQSWTRLKQLSSSSHLNNTKIYDITVLETRSPKWVSLSENQGVDKVCVPLRGESTSWPCLVSASRGHLHSLAHSPFSVFKVLSIASSNLWLSLLSCKNLFHYIGPSQIIQDNCISNFFELITSAKSLFSCKVIYSIWS